MTISRESSLTTPCSRSDPWLQQDLVVADQQHRHVVLLDFRSTSAGASYEHIGAGMKQVSIVAIERQARKVTLLLTVHSSSPYLRTASTILLFEHSRMIWDQGNEVKSRGVQTQPPTATDDAPDTVHRARSSESERTGNRPQLQTKRIPMPCRFRGRIMAWSPMDPHREWKCSLLRGAVIVVSAVVSPAYH